MDAQEIHKATMEDSDEESTMNTTIERRSTTLAAEIVTLIRGRNYGAAEARGQTLKGMLAQEAHRERCQRATVDAFIDAINWRIDNIDMVSEDDGMTDWTKGQRTGFKYALAIYRDCKKNKGI